MNVPPELATWMAAASRQAYLQSLTLAQLRQHNCQVIVDQAVSQWWRSFGEREETS
jgi:hypothetical protein